ncbi:substrate-binding periplasmic protein [Halopseudomonas pelagia]|uniref:substrate-binding periplasmic protein n=1 Tax=Halopseudomonas pelagia TaxID=553151 RepID=UPI0003A80FA1|nr:transporter substrate-binding domain-containing protein [Halopseudomonas pelagia]|tara:strand:- start:186709 stop:187575 length:867 start_codon:yes stop_codon:yes gene_type:complete
MAIKQPARATIYRVLLIPAALLGLLGVGSAQAAGGVCERIVVTGNPQYPPILWVNPDDDKHLVGAGVELLEMALEGTGVKAEVLNVGPWSRAQEEVRSGRVDMLAGAFLTRERLGYMDYIYPPYVEVPSVLFVKRGEVFPYSGWDDLRDKTGSTLLNNSYGMAFDRFSRDHLRVEQVSSIEQSFQTLVRGRVDYVIYERYQGMAVAQQLGIEDQLEIIEGSLINEQLYYTLSHNSACNSPQLRAILAQNMQDLASKGEPRRLLEKYRQVWADRFAPEDPQLIEQPLAE